MKSKSLKFKVLLIFSIPALALIYFSYISLMNEYKQLNNITAFKLSSKVTEVLSSLLHNLQLERGLSSGYLAKTSDSVSENKLLEQYAKTDIAYEQLLNIIKSKSNERKLLEKFVSEKAKPLMSAIMLNLQKIKNTRQEVLNLSIPFKDMIHQYNNTNTQLILAMRVLRATFNHIQSDAKSIETLQELKEYAGQERAFSYHQILSKTFDDAYIENIKQLQLKQNDLIEDFFINASMDAGVIYNDNYHENIKSNLQYCRTGILEKTIQSDEADKCFEASTRYINMLAKISGQLLALYARNANILYDNSLKSLYITSFLWIISFIALIFLTYILKKLISREEAFIEKLRITSYAFETQEAITITDLNGNIVKVNEAFTLITGYKASEVIGQNPRILKSSKQNDAFYQRMWQELITYGQWKGELYNKRKNGEIFPEILSINAIKDENNITTNYIGQFIDISDIKNAQQNAEYQANHDFLTNLFNRKALMQKLNEEFIRAKRHNFLHAFLFIDLDDFKNINDSFGHNIGDMLIIEVSKRITNTLRKEDIIARISGDEFGIILLNLNNNEAEAAKAVQEVCKKILQEISREFTIHTHRMEISLSIGIIFFPDNDTSINDMLIHADKALYKAKKQGKNQFVFFDNTIEIELKQFTKLEKEIKNSIINNDFVFFYQPKVDTFSGKIRGAEMLIRWRHPQKGLLYPDSFIEMSEQIGVIHKFSTLALETACNFLKSNLDIFSGCLAVNINSKEILHPNFEKEVISIISKNGVNPSRIELEITETAIIKDFDLVVGKIKNLQAFGIKFSIDDFGTGYSSITYLQKLPVNTLKIDKSFIQNLAEESNQELVKMIINMAKTFNMNIVAEGIENESELKFIQDNNVQQYQGFYFSRAVNEESFKTLLLK
ncbi:EAL domain-containing protein [bacterium]|nr:EAL domain-containing protein [bacterium]MBU1993102.1 EAL domain-containing protein [bacterium]